MPGKKITETDNLKSTNRTLIVALIIAVFFLGVLTNKVSTFNQTGSPTIPTGATQGANPTAVPTNQKPKDVTERDHIRGNKNAKVTLIEYSDFECPFCKSFHPTTQELLKTYGDKIRLVYRHFPLSFHANAQKEAEASECIADLAGNDAFWKFVDAIFERTTSNGTGFALDKLGPLAAELGVGQTQFQQCLDSAKFEEFVKDQMADGTAAGVSGTPGTFIINSKGESQLVVGAQPIDAFKTEIDKALSL